MDGATSIDVGVGVGDDVRRAVVEGGGFTLLATNMWLDLSAVEPRRPTELRLDPMDDAEFEVFRRDQETSYAAERAASGEPPERAARVAREQLAGLLPDGRHSADQHFFTGRVGAEPVGMLWLASRGSGVFVYDVVVAEQLRGRGLGRALMTAAEGWARERGATGVGLNVFGHNVVARRLYDSLGYAALEEYWQRPSVDDPPQGRLVLWNNGLPVDSGSRSCGGRRNVLEFRPNPLRDLLAAP